ncbi:Alpha/Beta hydrolase protein [Kockovaella imperatae]|uniref:GPI inositol-deacylase n=1 Tax=Kockovaella imperatae TaxID=4999 RepID=A0A1Y1UGX5_9TREE|nr:Alpha/Beta hydrolase protein [Kockovaella imperatae]ORX36325.1 Alpha/Beta hydrolase protein [Kockovaella imperatae]
MFAKSQVVRAVRSLHTVNIMSSTFRDPTIAKGKQRAETMSHDDNDGRQPNGNGMELPPESISNAIEDALATPLPGPKAAASLGSPFERPSPIALPPRAHHPSFMPRPQLLSQLTRSTLPTASLSHASADPNTRRAVSDLVQHGESSTAWQRAAPMWNDGSFPDLDSDGLPPDDESRGSIDSQAPSLYLQRTITDLLSTPDKPANDISSYLPKFQLPQLPQLPNLPSLGIPGISGRSAYDSTGARRNFSTSPASDDWWPSSWWGKNKGKVDRLVTEDDQAATVEEEKEGIQKKYRTPKNPIVFCHGLLGFDYIGPASLPPFQVSHWRGIREVLEANGVEVLIGRVPATGSIADRAAALEEMISSNFPDREVNLIGHSMGGLDCRYLISSLKPKNFVVSSLTTIATPHRGSAFADHVIDNLIGRERLPSLLAVVEALKLPAGGDGSAFNALGTKSMAQFNSEVLDSPQVKYYSWGASFDPGLLDTFRYPHTVIMAKEGPNDGLVSVESAKWGEYRGTLMGVNHLDLVGWVNTIRYAIADWAGKPISFKPATFYLEISDYLAEQGF